MASRGYADLHEHLAALKKAGLLITVERPINKDTEMHPLVRWQFRGGIEERDRKAFLFTNVVDSKGRKYDMPVVVGALAASREIYRLGMGCDLERINETWSRALANPIEPRVVRDAPCQEIVTEGSELDQPGKGLDSLPIPISRPGCPSMWSRRRASTCWCRRKPRSWSRATSRPNMSSPRRRSASPTATSTCRNSTPIWT